MTLAGKRGELIKKGRVSMMLLLKDGAHVDLKPINPIDKILMHFCGHIHFPIFLLTA